MLQRSARKFIPKTRVRLACFRLGDSYIYKDMAYICGGGVESDDADNVVVQWSTTESLQF
jgi:hypothetical protein